MNMDTFYHCSLFLGKWRKLCPKNQHTQCHTLRRNFRNSVCRPTILTTWQDPWKKWLCLTAWVLKILWDFQQLDQYPNNQKIVYKMQKLSKITKNTVQSNTPNVKIRSVLLELRKDIVSIISDFFQNWLIKLVWIGLDQFVKSNHKWPISFSS